MRVTWKKKNKNLKPAVLLSHIEASRTVAADGRVSFAGFEVHNTLPAVQSMLDFSSSATEWEKSTVMWRALASLKGSLTPDTFLEAVNAEIRTQNAVKDTSFHVLSALSIKPTLLPKTTRVDGVEVRFLPREYSKRYRARNALVADARLPVPPTPASYVRTVVVVKAKGALGAVTRALRAMDILRGAWCLLGNSSMELMGKDWEPINVARLGPVHTVHTPIGSLASQELWFEPSFAEASPFRPSDPTKFRKSVSLILRRISICPYRDVLIDTLLRYVRALDERDQNTAFVKLWGALENLASPGGANYDQIVRRCSFLYSETAYHRQILEHLREYRNQSVHSGDQTERAKTRAFQAQYYFFSLFLFHIRNAGKFSTLDDANFFLDLPPDPDLLRKRTKMLRGAIRFQTPPPPGSAAS
jgi:hypothetical protein